MYPSEWRRGARQLPVLIAIIQLAACSGTHRDDGSAELRDPAAGEPSTPEPGGSGGATATEPPAGAGQQEPMTEPQAGVAGMGMVVEIDPTVLVTLLPAVEEAFEALQEPDFVAPPQEVAEQECGSLFRVDELSHVVTPFDSELEVHGERVFDSMGRLVLATERTSPPTGFMPAHPMGTRLQIDYDAAGRVTRVREGESERFSGKLGTVIDFEHAPDGSFTALMTTTRVHHKTPEDPGLVFGAWGFCERMEFDAAGRLTRTSWGCDVLEESRTFTYDAQGRPLEAHGRTFGRTFSDSRDTRFGEAEEWTIRWDYTRAGEVSVIWNELDQRGGLAKAVTQRLVRTLDEAGRVTRSEFDYADDGSIDERFDYRYPDASSVDWDRREYDFGVDGVIDAVEERFDEGGKRVAQTRDMAQWGDEERHHFWIGHLYAEPRHAAFPQSTQRLVTEPDAQARTPSAELTIRGVPQHDNQAYTIIVRQTQHFTAEGYADELDISKQTDGGDLLAERHASCSLVAACQGQSTAIAAPEPLLSCSTQGSADLYWLTAPIEPQSWLPPPFDRIEALESRRWLAVGFIPRPPRIRELVGY